MNRAILIFLLTILTLYASAQYTVKGIVKEKGNKPLADVTVMLLSKDSLISGAVTDKNGVFKFENMKAQSCQLFISSLGYKEIRQNMKIDRTFSLPAFILEEDAKVLSEITVSAKRSDLINSNANSTTFHLSEEALKNSSDAFEALREVPKLMVNPIEKTIKMTDGSSPLILINGVSRPSYLQTLDPSDITAVEIIENPSARYRGNQSVNCILNLKVKRKQQTYTNARLYSSQNITKGHYGNSSGAFEMGNSKASVFVNANHFFWNDDQAVENSLHNGNMIRNTAGRMKNKSHSIDVNLGGDWLISDKDYMSYGIKLWYDPIHYTNNEMGSINSEIPSYAINISGKNKYNYNSNEYFMYYKHQYSDLKVLELTGRVGNYNSDISGWREEKSDISNYRSDIDMNNSKWSYALESNYSFGIKEMLGFDIGNNAYHQQMNIDDKKDAFPKFTYKEWRDYAYLSATSQSGSKFSYAASIGLDMVFTNSENVSNHYINFVPTLSLAYRFNQHNILKFQANRNRQSPSVSSLNPRNVSTDSLYISTGNPYLKPTIDNQIGLRYEWSYKALFVNPYIKYDYFTDEVEAVGKTVNDIYYGTYENIGSYRFLETGLSTGVRLGQIGNFYTGMSYCKNYYKNFPFSGNTISLYGSLYLHYQKASISIYANTQGNRYTQTSKSLNHCESGATFAWKFSQQFSAHMNLRYFMPSYSNKTWEKDGSHESYNKTITNHLMPMIGFSYYFKNSVNNNRQKKQLYSTDEGMRINLK